MSKGVLPGRCASRQTHEEFFRSYMLASIALTFSLIWIIAFDDTIYPAIGVGGVDLVTTLLTGICYRRLKRL